jgi:hypothetical protein
MSLPDLAGPSGFRWVNRLLLLAVALAGIAHVAFLPPFEGFDETNHFSYIQQIADTGTIPRVRIDKASADVEAYQGPHAYSASAPYDKVNGGLTYRSFFNGGSIPRLNPENELAYRPGHVPNAEAQHPPLYYAVMVPFYLVAKSWSWPGVFLILRLASWALAFAGFLIGCLATQQALLKLKTAPALCLLPAAWPFLFPEFFPEMARLGNDSLCLFLMGIGWWLMLRILERGRVSDTLWLGVMLGFGLLTKAFFVPTLAGCVCLLCFQELRDHDGRQLRNAVVLAIVSVLIGGGWYLYRYLTVGNFIVANDIMALQDKGSVLGQVVSSFGIPEAIRGIGQLVVSFAWAGTWSYGRFHPIFTLPVILLAAFPLYNWAIRLRWAPSAVIAPLFIVSPMVLGLIYYMLTQIARGPEAAGTPGWYLHMMAGPLSLALVIGWRWRRIQAVLAAYAILYHAVLWAMQLSLFSGCAFKAGNYKYTQFDFGGCFIVPERLAVLGEPVLGALALAAAIILGGFAALSWRRLSLASPLPAPGRG